MIKNVGMFCWIQNSAERLLCMFVSFSIFVVSMRSVIGNYEVEWL